MATHQAQSAIRRVFDEAFNQGNLTVIDELLSSDHLAHNAFGRAPNGPQGLKWLIAMFRTAFPDLHCIVEDEFNEGDKFSARWTLRGTQQGPFIGNPPTGKPVSVPGLIMDGPWMAKLLRIGRSSIKWVSWCSLAWFLRHQPTKQEEIKWHSHASTAS